jgi:hypothetical protein
MNAKERMTNTTLAERDFLLSYGVRLAQLLRSQDPTEKGLEEQIWGKKFKTTRKLYREVVDLLREKSRAAETLWYAYRSGQCHYETEHYEESVTELSEI